MFMIELDEEEIDDELELPQTLRNISIEEKRELLEFKKNHNEVSDRYYFYSELTVLFLV
jgi:hypothetical protein